MDKDRIAHDLALIIVENVLEDIDDEFGIRQYSLKAADIYKKAKEIIMTQLDQES